MLCLSGFELYSRWVPLLQNKRLSVACRVGRAEYDSYNRVKLKS